LSLADLKRAADWKIKGVIPEPQYILNPKILYPPLPSDDIKMPDYSRKIRLFLDWKYYREGRESIRFVKNGLRYFAFRWEQKIVQKNLKYFEQMGGQQDFIKLIKNELAWRKKVEALDGVSLNKLVQKMRHELITIPREFTFLVTGWGSRLLHDDYIARKLLELAAKKGHKKAKVLDYLSRERRYATMDIQMKTRGLAHIEDLKQEALNQTSEIADRDYLPAQFDLFHRLSNGWQVKQDYAAAYYWGKRALKNGAKIKINVSAIAERLSTEDKKLIRQWNKSKVFPTLQLKY